MVRAFLIGAGATFAQYPEAPLSNNFLTKFKKFNRTIFDDLQIHMEPYIPASSFMSSNIENVMNMLTKLDTATQSYLKEIIHQAIYDLLANITNSTPNDISSYLSGNVRGQTIFKKILIDKRLLDHDFFMTLNYDLYLDREILVSRKGKIDYGISGIKAKSFNRNFSLSRDNILTCLHLHGALHWESDPEGIIVNDGAIRPIYSRTGSNICLMPPGIKEENQLLAPIWDFAYRKMNSADELIIIGCSLNPDDIRLVSLIKSFVKKVGIENVKIVHKADPEFKCYQNYKKVVGEGFQDYSSGLDIRDSINFILDKSVPSR